MVNPWWTAFGLLAAVCSAALLYAASRHCLWPVPRRLARSLALAGLALASLALGAWIVVLGPVTGTCVMLVTWMLALPAWPWLALLTTRATPFPASGDT